MNRHYKLFSLFVLAFFVVSNTACDNGGNDSGDKRSGHYITPTEKLNPSQWPNFIDDIDFKDMDTVLERQLKRYKQLSLQGTVKFGNDTYPMVAVRKTLDAFVHLSKKTRECLLQASFQYQRENCYRDFNETLLNDYTVYVPRLDSNDSGYGKPQPAFFTGYYTPLLEGKFNKQGEFKYGIYDKPKNAILANKTRREIDFEGALDGTGYELFYTKDLFANYLLHVEGGGKVIVRDNGAENSYYISYAGTNKKEWNWISKYMVKKGYINDYSIASQRAFLKDNPQLWKEIYSTCPSYVFFKVTSTPPQGSDLVPLTDGRSIATDDELYGFKGVLSFVESKRLKKDLNSVDFIDYSRFYLDQDTGGAIVGKARADIYFGEGLYAERSATLTQQNGKIYFLMLTSKISKSFPHKK